MIRPRLLEQKSLPRAWEEIEGIHTTLEQKINRDEVVIVDNHSTPDPTKMLSANQGVVLWNAIQAIAGQGSKFDALALLAEKFGKNVLQGTLPKNSSSIAVGQKLHSPTIFLDGVRLDETQFTVDLDTGTIALSVIWSVHYDVTWVVIDELPYHIKFSYPSMAMLQATSESFKNAIQINDVIEILGTNGADDGGHYLVKCQETQGLNGVEIITGKWLNEVPNTKIKDKLDMYGKAVDSDKLDGQDSTYFAKQSDMTSANTQIEKNKSDILYSNNKLLNMSYFIGKSVDETGDDVWTNRRRLHTIVNIQNAIGTLPSGYTSGVDNDFIVETFNNATNWGRQILRDIRSNKVFERHRISGTLQDWTETFSTGNCPMSKTANGYCRLANGLIIQWVQISTTVGSLASGKATGTITLPIAFNTNSFIPVGSSAGTGVTEQSNVLVSPEGNNVVRYWQTDMSANGRIMCIAIGY